MSDNGLPPFDPGASGGAVTRTIQRALRFGAVRRFSTVLVKRSDPWLHALTRGRLGERLAMPLASLTTTGARSGEPRTTAILYITDGDDVILVASNFGGDRHPAWYHNLKANPVATLQRGDRIGRYSAVEVVEETERTRLFTLVDQVYSGYADYRERTDAIGRRIPIVRLTQLD